MKIGDPMPLCLQLADRLTDKYVQATLRDDEGTTLETVNLSHVSEGLYADFLTPFPNDTVFVTCQYLVYDDSGYTVLSEDEGAALDTFFRDPESGGGAICDGFDNITGVVESGGAIVGVVEDC
jgi:hypothetical protein